MREAAEKTEGKNREKKLNDVIWWSWEGVMVK